MKITTKLMLIIVTGPALWIEKPKITEAKNGKLSTLEEIDKRHIIQALNSTGWKVSGGKGAAEILAMNPKTLESTMKKLGIKREKMNF